MFEVFVNRLTFDFTCRTERAARAISKEIVHYKASSINSIISEILSKKTDPDYLWKIDRLEIDLGNIRLEDIETEYILLQFKEQLARSIDETRSSVQRDSFSSISAVSPEDDRLILLKTLLLTGDLPWWVDKNTFTGIDSVIRVILGQRKEELKEFLDGQRNNPDLVIRIKSLSSKETVSLLDELVPGIADLSSIKFFDKGRKKALSDIVFEPEMEQSPLENLKLVLIDRILTEPGRAFLSGLAKLGILSAPEMARLNTFIDARSRGSKLQATEILKKLTVFQLGFLSHQVEWKIPDEEDSSPVESRKKIVHWLLGKMEVKNAALESELMTVSLPDLHSLMKIFRSYGRKDSWKRIWIETLMEDHRFFQMNLLSLLVDKSEDDFRIAIRGLTSSRLLALHQIISSGSIPSPAGKKIIVKILGRLPEKSLSRISGLVRMEKKEVEALIPVSVVEDSATNTLKTIVENAGLCLFAPYLPAFFDRLGLTENGKFSSKKPAYRAAYLLEYLVHGRQRNYEYTMQFNKLLCGLDIREPLPGYKRLTPKERKEAEELTESVILNWKTLKSTGLKGFRQSFLQRKGILTEQEGFWVLQVEKKGYDLLLDSIPWSFNRIKFSWMEKMIQVEW